jgi:S-formylglutathione hydrolase FrmB
MTRQQKTWVRETLIGLTFVWALWAQSAQSAQAADKLQFSVTFTQAVQDKPFTGRVLVFLGRANSQPRFGPGWFSPTPFFAKDVKDLKPGDTLVIGDDALAYPTSISQMKPGEYAIQAVIDRTLDTHDVGSAAGNGFSTAITKTLDPATSGTVALTIDQVSAGRTFNETERVKLVEIDSKLLSKFRGHPVKMRAGVVLPEGYAENPDKKYPVLYVIPGFGGNHFGAAGLQRSALATAATPAIQVMLDPDCNTGHSVFADSANNGPVGQALITELIPHIEKAYRAESKPWARFVNGHSSGGWSSLWLQVAYPDFFGGTWSTSPDPIDFRDFQQIDIYRPNENFYKDSGGTTRPVARRGETPFAMMKDFCDQEVVLGHGGQMQSFEAVFGPRGADGKPKPLWDRKTGEIDPIVAEYWKKYDINLILEKNWSTLSPKLKGKLHVITGSLDTFYLEGAVKLVKKTLEGLGSDAVVEIHPGKDHGSVMTPELRSRISTEIWETYQRNKAKQKIVSPSITRSNHVRKFTTL